MLGAGAANIAVARIIIEAGITPGNIVMVDSKGILNRQRTDLSETFRAKWDMALKTNKEGRTGGLAEAIKGADALLAMAAPGPGVIPSRLIRTMSDDPIVFACANPYRRSGHGRQRRRAPRSLPQADPTFPTR